MNGCEVLDEKMYLYMTMEDETVFLEGAKSDFRCPVIASGHALYYFLVIT